MTPFKVIKIALILITVLVVVIVGVFPLIREADTIYPQGFSKNGWEVVEVGMNKAEVSREIGEPLYKTPLDNPDLNDPQEWWQYSQTGGLGWPDLNDFVGGNYYRVFFNQEGIVVSKVLFIFY